MGKKTKNPLNLYERLQVSPRAEKEVLQAAYRALMVKYHPDKTREQTLAQHLNEAKDVLLDDKKRKEYDESLSAVKSKEIGNYEVLELIATGGFGKTYKARHILLDEVVCIKQANEISPAYEDVLIKEAKAIWDLRHSSLPAMRELLRLDDGSLALVMSYIPGPTLEKIIEKVGSLEAEHVAWIAERALSALWYLHMHGVIHGDVKPQNIIVQPENHAIVLVDFGLSAVKPSKSMRSEGYTPYFAPPEQQKQLGPLLPESDFYSLGMTMIYALGGDIGKKRVPSKTPDVLAEFIGKLIQYDIKTRPTWEKRNLVDEISDIREKAFGRRRSNLAPIPGV